jgi:hypothetical protein
MSFYPLVEPGIRERIPRSLDMGIMVVIQVVQVPVEPVVVVVVPVVPVVLITGLFRDKVVTE